MDKIEQEIFAHKINYCDFVIDSLKELNKIKLQKTEFRLLKQNNIATNLFHTCINVNFSEFIPDLEVLIAKNTRIILAPIHFSLKQDADNLINNRNYFDIKLNSFNFYLQELINVSTDYQDIHFALSDGLQNLVYKHYQKNLLDHIYIPFTGKTSIPTETLDNINKKYKDAIDTVTIILVETLLDEI